MGWFDEQLKNRKAADRQNFDAVRYAVENAADNAAEKIKSVSFSEMKKYLKMVTEKKIMSRLLLVNLIFALASTITPILTRDVVDGKLDMKLELFLVGAAVLELGLSALCNYMSADPEIWEGADLQENLAKKTISLPNEFFNRYSVADIAERIDLAGALSSACYSGVLQAVFLGIQALIFLAEIVCLGQSIAVAGLALIAITIAIIVPYANARRLINGQSLKYRSEEGSESISIIKGIQKIRLAGSERRAYSRWGKLYSKVIGFEYALPTVVKLCDVFICTANLAGMIILYTTSYKKGVSVAEFYAITAAYALLSSACIGLVDASENIAMLSPVIRMLQPIVDTPSEGDQDDADFLDLKGSIVANNIVFSYDKGGKPVIDGISIDIKPGEYVAICGESGCGKSTLLRLLLGFLEPDSGEIFYDGKNIKEYNIKSLRKSIGTVLQDGKIFHDDIRQNILISAPHLGDSDALEALELAQFKDDLDAMPMGLDTFLTEGNGGISGGQRQRLLLARALVTKPKNIILDEATSALDNITQKKVSDAMDAIKATRVVVAHRLSTIKNADRILLLANGKIAESGTYKELIEKGGAFAKLVEKQRLDI